jgi:hypothetical protein
MSTKGIRKARSGVAAGKLGGSGQAAQPSIVFSNPSRDESHVSGWTLALLETIMGRAGVKRIYITSTYRSPHDQARVMRVNLTGKKSMYGGHGRRVEAVARNIVLIDKVGAILADAIGKLPGVEPTGYTMHSRDEIVASMAEEIEALERQHGQGCVSRHQIDPMLINVLDISSAAIAPRTALAPFIAALTAAPWIARIGLPKGSKATHSKHFVETQPCIHLEIPQPIDMPSASRFGNVA